MKKIVFTNVNLFDGRMSSELVRDVTLFVEQRSVTDGVITRIERSGETAVSRDHQTIDLKGKYVIPGFINVHGHLFGTGAPIGLAGASDKAIGRIVKLMSGPLRFLVKRRMRNNAQVMLHGGVTTARMAGDINYFDVAVRDEIEAGKFLGARLQVAGKMICVTGGHGAFIAHIADSPWEGRKAARDCLRNGSDVIKILSTGGVMDSRRLGEAGRPQMTVAEIEAVCDEAHRAGYKVMTHCQSTQGIRDALAGGVDSIEHGAAITDDLIDLFKNNPKALKGYTTLVPTLSAPMDLVALGREVVKISEEAQQNSKMILNGMFEGLRTALKHDIPLAMGTDASVPFVPQYEFWRELVYYQHFADVSNKKAINIATEQGAKLMDLEEVTGTLEVGKSADFIVLNGNPLEDLMTLEHPVHVVSRGNLIKKPTYRKVKAIEQHNAERFFERIRPQNE